MGCSCSRENQKEQMGSLSEGKFKENDFVAIMQCRERNSSKSQLKLEEYHSLSTDNGSQINRNVIDIDPKLIERSEY